MYVLPDWLRRHLSDPNFRRRNKSVVDETFAKLGVSPGDALRTLYLDYGGPFGSDYTGFELLDLVEDAVSVLSLTMSCRRDHGFPNHYLVLSNLLGGAVLVYDCRTESVFNVDFEGGDRELIAGTLEPEWPHLIDFLAEFFGGAGHPGSGTNEPHA